MSDPKAAQENITPTAKRIRELKHEVEMLTNAGVIECMVRNKAVAEYIGQLEAEVARLRVDGATLWKALNDLSFECYGGIGPTSPTIKTYNRTFGVMDSMREKYAAKESADDIANKL